MKRRVYEGLVYPDGAYWHGPRSDNDSLPRPPKRAKVLKVEDLRIPIHVALGAYESASTEELDDLITDLQAERARR